MPSSACKARSPRSRLGRAKRLAPTNTEIRNAVKVDVRSMWFGDFQRIGMCCRTAPAKPIFLSRNEIKTAIPPNGARRLRLAQNQSFIRQQSADLARDWFVRRVGFQFSCCLTLGSCPMPNFAFQA